MTKLIITGVVIAVALLVTLACKSKKAATAPTEAANGIIWGSGGGFTGKTVSFQLLESGQVFRTDATSANVPMKTIKAKVAKAMFSAAKELNLTEIAQNTPGNMSYFLELNVEGKPHRITWGDSNTEVPAKVKDFHRVLNQLVTTKTD